MVELGDFVTIIIFITGFFSFFHSLHRQWAIRVCKRDMYCVFPARAPNNSRGSNDYKASNFIILTSLLRLHFHQIIPLTFSN